MAMDERKQRVLRAIVSLYSVEGEPVGSSVLANYFDMAVSSANAAQRDGGPDAAGPVGTAPHLGRPGAQRQRLPLLYRPPAGRQPAAGPGGPGAGGQRVRQPGPRARPAGPGRGQGAGPDERLHRRGQHPLRRRSVHRPLRGGAGGAERRRHPGRHLGGLRPHAGGPGAGGPDPGKGRPSWPPCSTTA